MIAFGLGLADAETLARKFQPEFAQRIDIALFHGNDTGRTTSIVLAIQVPDFLTSFGRQSLSASLSVTYATSRTKYYTCGKHQARRFQPIATEPEGVTSLVQHGPCTMKFTLTGTLICYKIEMMVVQDDVRERELLMLFSLERITGAGRADTDANLVLGNAGIPFELKSTTKASVTTVRDFGPDHVLKWKDKHWLIGFYEPDGVHLKHCVYGSPKMMAPWIKEKEEYVRVDFALARSVPHLLTAEGLYELLGKKDLYSVNDARLLHKRQYSKAQYIERQDREDGYSPERMLEILKERCRYVILRGATLNNPHIPGSYFNGWERITSHHAARLRELVAQALRDEAKERAGEASAAEASARAIDKATR